MKYCLPRLFVFHGDSNRITISPYFDVRRATICCVTLVISSIFMHAIACQSKRIVNKGG